MTLLPPRKATESEPGAVFLPSGVYGMYGFAESRTWQYPSSDGTALISAGDDFAKGHMEWGTKMADLLRAFGLQQVVPGNPFYLSSESEGRTYKGSVTAAGSVTGVEVFAEAGGESVVQDERGNVYVAAGQILVYSPAGKLIEKIDVPERPIDLVFGGADRRTLFILTHHSLYSVKAQVAGL